MNSFISCGSMRHQLGSCSNDKTNKMACLENPIVRAKGISIEISFFFWSIIEISFIQCAFNQCVFTFVFGQMLIALIKVEPKGPESCTQQNAVCF